MTGRCDSIALSRAAECGDVTGSQDGRRGVAREAAEAGLSLPGHGGQQLTEMTSRQPLPPTSTSTQVSRADPAVQALSSAAACTHEVSASRTLGTATGAWPYKALLVRGIATVALLDDVVPEYAQAADRYFGPEQGAAWLSQLQGQPMARVSVTPTLGGRPRLRDPVPSALSAQGRSVTRPQGGVGTIGVRRRQSALPGGAAGVRRFEASRCRRGSARGARWPAPRPVGAAGTRSRADSRDTP